MNISEIWIRRPIMTILVMITVLFFGILSYKSLPINNLSDVAYPVIQVSASLPGSNPQQMAANVAMPLERQFATIDGLESMNSVNTMGQTTVVMQFSLSKNIDAVNQDVNNAIRVAMSDLPPLPQPPTSQKVNPSDEPIIYYTLTSDTIPMSDVYDYAQVIFAQNLSTVEGVSQVLIYGSDKYAVRIKVDPQKMQNRNVGFNELVNTIINANVNLPGGTVYNNEKNFMILPNGQLFKADYYNNIVLSYYQGTPIRIKDIGNAYADQEYNRVYAWTVDKKQSKKTIMLAIKKQPHANTTKVAKAIIAQIPELQKMVPKGVQTDLLYDGSEYIQESIDDVEFTLVFTIILVIIVIFFFIRSFRVTIIPSLAIILSIIGTFIVMKVCGFSVNNLSMMAITLSVGFVVDDAIVMMENIIRHAEEGKDALTASLVGSKEIGFTIISMTTSLVVVFVPLLFMPGLIGNLFREFSVSIAAAIIISGILSLTFTPMLCSIVLRKFNPNNSSGFYKVMENIFNTALNWYSDTLTIVLNHKRTAIFITFLMLVFFVYFLMIIPKTFLPSQDQCYFDVQTLASEQSSFIYMREHQSIINDILIQDPDVINVLSVSSYGSDNSGFVFVKLKPINKRKRNVDTIINQLRPKVNSIPGITCYLNNPPALQVSSQSTRATYQFTLKSIDLDSLYKYTPILVEKMQAMPALIDVNTDLQMNAPQLEININRDKASFYGVTATDIENVLAYAYAGGKISNIYTQTNLYKVIVEVDVEYRKQPLDLNKLYIKSSQGKLIPLNMVADIVYSVGPISVNHAGELPSTTISFNVAPNASLDKAMKQIQEIANEILPTNVTPIFQGSAQVFTDSFSSFMILLLITIFIIYVVLGILYESFWHPITILSSLPPAGFGALLTLLIFGLQLELYALIGLIMLIGIVKKNGIMMVDFAVELERNEHLDPQTSIHKAAVIRFRPIMMTSFAAFFGCLPIALGIGAGGDARRGLGIIVMGGLFFSQIITLYITPVFYVYFARIDEYFRNKNK